MALMKTSLVLLLSLSICIISLGKEITSGETAEVEANSIWFWDQANLTHWQELKKGGDGKARKAYEEKTLGTREAFQFLKPLPVKVLTYDAGKQQVNVEMTTQNRMLGSKFWIDAEAVGK